MRFNCQRAKREPAVQLLGLASPPPVAKATEPPTQQKEETQRLDLVGYWIGSPAGILGSLIR